MKSKEVLAKIVVIGLTALCASFCAPAIGKTNTNMSASTGASKSSAVEIAKRSVEDRAKKVEARSAYSSLRGRISVSMGRSRGGHSVILGKLIAVAVQPIQEVSITKPSKKWKFAINTEGMAPIRWDDNESRRNIFPTVSAPSVPIACIGQVYNDSEADEQVQINPDYPVVVERGPALGQPEAIIVVGPNGANEGQPSDRPVLEQVCLASASLPAGDMGGSSPASSEALVSSDMSSAPATRMAQMPARSPQPADTPEPSAMLALSAGLITLGSALKPKRK